MDEVQQEEALMMRTSVLTFLLSEGGVYLARLKDTDAAGMWDGYRDQVGRGETARRAALRIVREKAGVLISVDNLQVRGTIHTTIGVRPHARLHIFTTGRWAGNLAETESMGEPSWFEFDELPRKWVHEEEKLWLSRVFAGDSFEATMVLSLDGTRLLRRPQIENAK